MSDFSGAVKWLEGVGDQEKRHAMEARLLSQARVYGNREESLKWGAEILERNRWVSHEIYLGVSQVVGEDPGGSVEWVRENFPDPLLQEELFNTLLHQWRWQDPAGMVDSMHLMPDDERRKGLAWITAKTWADRDLEAAQEWANGMEESPERDEALLGVAQVWMDKEMEEVGRWVEELEAGEFRDRAVSSYVGSLRVSDPERAVEMAEGIGNEFRRDEALHYVFRKWIQDDEAAASQAIEENEFLSETSRWRLTEGRKR